MADTAATVELVGGHVALDLVNSVSWRLDPQRRSDYLSDAPSLAAWLERTGVLGSSTTGLVLGVSGRTARQTLGGVRDLRERLHESLAPLADGLAPPESLVVPAALNERLTDAVGHARLTGFPLRWHLEPTHPADVVRLLALSVLDLLTSDDLDRVHRCDGPGCGWVFLDRSRSRTRRWCSSSDCGNRDRARRHYARHRRGAGAGAGPEAHQLV